jgi:hypothetical protein
MNRYLSASVLIITAVLIQQLAGFSTQNTFTNSLTNWLHVPMFAGITATLLWLQPEFRIWRLGIVVLSIAILTEVLQYFTDRQASFSDLGRDILGFVLAAVCLQRSTLRNYLALSGVTAIATMIVPGSYLVAYAYQSYAFPVLYTPEDRLASILAQSNSYTKLTIEHEWQEYADGKVLHVTWSSNPWPGLHFAEPIKSWQGYSTLLIDVFNLDTEPQPLTAGVRHNVNGGTSRYLTMELTPGHNRLSINLADLAYLDSGQAASIKHLMLYTTQSHAGQEILLGQVRLE